MLYSLLLLLFIHLLFVCIVYLFITIGQMAHMPRPLRVLLVPTLTCMRQASLKRYIYIYICPAEGLHREHPEDRHRLPLPARHGGAVGPLDEGQGRVPALETNIMLVVIMMIMLMIIIIIMIIVIMTIIIIIIVILILMIMIQTIIIMMILIALVASKGRRPRPKRSWKEVARAVQTKGAYADGLARERRIHLSI